MPWTCADIPDQTGRVALITGASSGLGLETARALAERGATVLLACRSPQRLEATLAELRPTARGELHGVSLDLADLSSVAGAAAAVSRQWSGLDLLINNAGVMALPRQLSRDGLELQFATNHLGHFALTAALLPLLEQRPQSRVVSVSSGAHHFGRIDFEDLQGERDYDRWRAYAQSKLANLLFALQLQRRLEARGSTTRSLAAHPGVAWTRLQTTSVEASGQRLEAWAYRLMRPLGQSAAMGALPLLEAATAEDLPGGSYRGPGGLTEMRGWPGPARLSARARDPQLAERFWQVSEALLADATARTAA